jgi:5-methylthioadenosine/S-adenosylhomocysteine deaminase
MTIRCFAASGLTRRRMVQLSAAAAVALPRAAIAQSSTGANRLPTRGDILIRGGSVLTMDTAVPDLDTGDVHIRDGRIVAVGARLDVPGAQVIEARDMIVLPGFIDTHNHLWNAFLRGSIRGDDPVLGYFPVTNRAADLCTPDDVYNSVRFGLAEGLMSGITTINNFSHNTRSPAHADAEIRAMLESGMRGRFSYGPAGRGKPGEMMDMADVARVQGQWLKDNPLLTLGVNLRLPAPPVLKSGGDDDVFVKEIAEARRLDLPISVHYGNVAHGLVAFLQTRGLLGSDWLIIHTQGFTPEERQQMVAAKVKFSMSPAIEMPYSTVRNGYIQFAELEEMGAQLSLSIDAASAMATSDFFTVMRALLYAHKQRADTKLKLSPKRIVELATIEGARTLGLDQDTGSLTPGKRADLILVRKTDPNIAPAFEPYHALVYSGQAGNVDTVVVDGRVLRKGGAFTALDIGETMRAVTASAVRIEGQMKEILKRPGAR